MKDDNEEEMRKTLHKVIHEGVENQIKSDELPEARITLERLMVNGYTRHESIHKLGKILLEEIVDVEREQRPFDRERYVKKLNEIE